MTKAADINQDKDYKYGFPQEDYSSRPAKGLDARSSKRSP